jgi:hypothetical protein
MHRADELVQIAEQQLGDAEETYRLGPAEATARIRGIARAVIAVSRCVHPDESGWAGVQGRLLVGALLIGLAVSGCGGGRAVPMPRHSTEKRVHGTAFQALPVVPRVEPVAGGAHTVFRIRIAVRQPLGVWDRTIHGYAAHVVKDPPTEGCIIDTDGYAQSGRPGGQAEIVLDPAQMMGHQWCTGTFRGTVRYYQAFACPASGPCQIPPGFPEHSAVVAHVMFAVRRLAASTP